MIFNKYIIYVYDFESHNHFKDPPLLQVVYIKNYLFFYNIFVIKRKLVS